MRIHVLSLSLLFSFSLGGFSLVTAEGHTGAGYEVWAADQSNSVADQDSLGVAGSWLWIWDEADVAQALDSGMTPSSKSCSPDATEGPCDLFTIFPPTLTDSASGETLAESSGFGRWHGITVDPQHKYVTANIFAPGGGYLGIVDTETKGAVALFRTSLMTYSRGNNETATTRNVHTSFWNHDGSAILIHNLAGKALERINVDRDDAGTITAVTFDKGATLGLGKEMMVSSEASYYQGDNAFGVPLLGAVTGSYDIADLGDLTPTGHCKEDGCSAAESSDATSPGRPNNVPICPIMAPNGLVFNTFGGGGLLVADSTKTPMTIVGAYGNSMIYGAGVCGESVGDKAYFTSGCSASGAGADQSMWILFGIDSTLFSDVYTENSPAPDLAFDFDGTATGGRTEGVATDDSGQIPGITTRRDAHDLTATIDGKYVHVLDRIQNVVDVFDVATKALVGTYDLTTATGVGGDGSTGPCAAASVTDGGDDFPINDPAPDFISATPDGKHMMISFRGPAPVSAGHAAQGSCPGVGIVELKDGGASGALVGVLRSVNTVPDTLDSVFPSGGVAYTGSERSDIHDVVVVAKKAPSVPATATPTEVPGDGPVDTEAPTETPASAGATASVVCPTALLLVTAATLFARF